MARKPEEKQTKTEFRKNRSSRVRRRNWTDTADDASTQPDVPQLSERITGKSESSRKRTVFGQLQGNETTGYTLRRGHEDDATCLPGVVIRAGGLRSTVRSPDGKEYQCAVRRLLKTIHTDQRHVIAAGDRVWFRPSGDDEGLIEEVEARYGVLCRCSRGRRQVIVANVDLMLIITSAAEPRLKPNLVDRLLVTAEQSGITPVICINKIDLMDPAELQPLVGAYAQLGYQVVLLAARHGQFVHRLRSLIDGRQSVVVGQSGVGKSSLLNALYPDLQLRVGTVSDENDKGKHTTTAAQLIALPAGGFIVDTPGIRQFQLWDIIPAELAGLFRDLRPYVNGCRFPNCTHTHEAFCAVKDAVGDGRLDARRYESYCHLHAGDLN
ncbi:MAG: ribosome small subunit-dependent GTPase A [Planctomycetota bacterium]|nr:ribosome small subunit-dependent GTPase A [Planctomycetota bacterium]MDA1178149.1 ribosome small subunit-dependent GTPase A [Planctomycetota bacterium]